MNLLFINFLLFTQILTEGKIKSLNQTSEELPYIFIKAIPDNKEPIRIKGQIQEFKIEKEIKNVLIYLYQNGIEKYRTKADSLGNFVIDSIIPANYLLVITNPYFYEQINFEAEKNYHYEIIYKPLIRFIQTEKPIIYLYPIKKQKIKIELKYDGDLTYSYPKYGSNGWTVIADSNGTLIDENGKEYYALFWEGEDRSPIKPKDGFVIKGENTIEFLEEKLAYLGLNKKEANEFIIYWLPKMEKNKYNLIHFSGEEYERMAELKIDPKPETIIRVMMIFQPLNSEISFPLQDLKPLKKERKGYTVVEWGGRKTEIINEININ